MLWERKYIGLASLRGQENPLRNGRWLSGLVKVTLSARGKDCNDSRLQLPVQCPNLRSLCCHESSPQISSSAGHLRSRIIIAGYKLKELSISRLKTSRPLLAGVGQLFAVPCYTDVEVGPRSSAVEHMLQWFSRNVVGLHMQEQVLALENRALHKKWSFGMNGWYNPEWSSELLKLHKTFPAKPEIKLIWGFGISL